MKSPQSWKPSKPLNQIKIITPPDQLDKSAVDIFAVDLNDEDQKYLVDAFLPYDVDVNIWSWNSNLNTDAEWLLNNVDQADQIILRYNKNNNLAPLLASKSNSFYLTDGQVNILDRISKNTVANIQEVSLYGI
jgi:hypothetical protein